MKLDIVAQLVHILKEAPEIGAIEIRRGPFGVWSSVRVSKAGHGANTAGQVFAPCPALDTRTDDQTPNGPRRISIAPISGASFRMCTSCATMSSFMAPKLH